jgi:hypothetical protein
MTVSPITSDQQDHLDGLIDAAIKRVIKEVNPGKEGLQRLFSRGGEFQDYLFDGFRRYCAPAPDYALAKSILGGDFITPEEIMAKRPVKYTDEQILALSAQLPSEKHLRWMKKNGYALVAAPPQTCSLLDVRLLNSTLFYSKEGGWYADNAQKFAREDKTSFGWIAIRKKPVNGSTNKNWGEQNNLLADTEVVPNAGEFAWFVTTFYEVRGVRLFKDVYVRVSSVDSGGRRVHLGFFDADGLDVNDYWDGSRFSDLGLSASRKF